METVPGSSVRKLVVLYEVFKFNFPSYLILGNATNVSYIRATKTRVTLLKVRPASDIDTPNKSATLENEHPCASLYRVKPNCCSGVVGKGFKGCVRYIFASLFFKYHQTRKNVFYFTSKALFVFGKIRF